VVTVAAIILAASTERALADADGLASVRRIADAAWSGGALPIVVVAADPSGAVGSALAGAEVTLAQPAPVADGPIAQIQRGIGVAREAVSDLDGALVWPARLAWVGPETVTSLIELHGRAPGEILRPSFRGEPGWPVLLPIEALEGLASVGASLMPDAIVAALLGGGVPARVVELGDPGTTIDTGTPLAELPAYEGPPPPPADQAHEWGAPVALGPDESPAGPHVVPYPPDERSGHPGPEEG
jgi:CTP:molybdopterin cytidylyltransferase MocA